MARKSFADLSVEEFNDLRDRHHMTKHDYETVKTVWDKMLPLLAKSLSLKERADMCYSFFVPGEDTLWETMYNIPTGLAELYSFDTTLALPEANPDYDKYSVHDVFPITNWKKWINSTKKAIKFAEKAVADAEWIVFMSTN